MKPVLSVIFMIGLFFISSEVFSQSTAILIGGEETELSPEGVITGRGSSLYGGLGAALLDTFNIYYQPLGEGDFQDNLFPDPEVYSFQMNIQEGLLNFQSQGIHGSFWDSRGREGTGVLPWINEEWRQGRFFNSQYLPAGDEPPFGLVREDIQWKIDYWDVDENDEINFIHTCLSGMVQDFHFDNETGDATALLVTLQTAYLGYGEDDEPGPGEVEYAGGAYQGFDSFRERSGLLDFPAYFFQYDGETNDGSLTPCGTKIRLIGEDGVKGYFETIQAAIDSSENGDTVLVAPGEYVENINFEGKAIVVMGNPDDPSEVVINGNEEGSCALFISGEGRESMLAGFTLTGGVAPDDGSGGGILIERSSPTITANIIRGNSAVQGGGGISVSFEDSAPLITRNLIYENQTESSGGGILLFECGGMVLNNTIIQNIASEASGGGVAIPFSNGVQIVNNVITNNFGCGLVGWNAENFVLSYNNVWNNQGNYHDVEAGEGSISENPAFVNFDERDLHLTEDSPCIDAGDPDLPEDPDGTRADMGAFYFHQERDENPHRLDVPEEYEFIQLAIEAAVDGDTVLVQPGTYAENLNLLGKAITVGSTFLTTGDPTRIDSTIIDGHQNGSPVVSIRQGEGEGTILTGLKIFNGLADYGAGVYCRGTRPTLRHLIIEGNSAERNGGGLYCTLEATPHAEDLTIRDNSAQRGGGIYLYNNTRLDLNGFNIAGNVAETGGGVSGATGAVLNFSGGEIRGNTCESNGAAISLVEGLLNLSYSLVYGNVSVQEQTALEANRTDVNLTNVTLVDNPGCALGLRTWYGEINVVNSILRGHSAGELGYFFSTVNISYSDVEEGVIEGVNWGEGNLDVDPLFADPEGGDYHLTWNSLCRDAGDPQSPPDPDGTRADLGAYYFDLTGIEDPDFERPKEFILHSAYPNPFNSTTTITYTLPCQSNVALQIYNTRGQMVFELLNRVMPAGRHKVVWDADGTPAGVYLVRLSDEIGNVTGMQKVVLVK